MVSADFEDAASFLSNASSFTSISNATKLELYGLYKLLTTSRDPPNARPGIFDFTGRAKWDAWKSAGQTWQGKESEAEERYKEIAKNLGWTPGATTKPIVSKSQPEEPTAEELLARDDVEPFGEGGGLGAGISTLQDQTGETVDGNTLHGLALQGDITKLEEFLEQHPRLNLDELDEYGFTALHLACDRGNADIAKLLLVKGANVTVKDADGLSALELARETNNESIVRLLEKYTSPIS